MSYTLQEYPAPDQTREQVMACPRKRLKRHGKAWHHPPPRCSLFNEDLEANHHIKTTRRALRHLGNNRMAADWHQITNKLTSKQPTLSQPFFAFQTLVIAETPNVLFQFQLLPCGGFQCQHWDFGSPWLSAVEGSPHFQRPALLLWAMLLTAAVSGPGSLSLS